MAHFVKNPRTRRIEMQETWFQSLGGEDPLEKEKATHFSIFAWKNPTNRGAWWATVPGVIETRT